MKNQSSQRTLRFYLELCAGIVAIISSVIFFIFDRQILGGDIRFDDSSYMTLIFMLCGGAVCLVDAFIPLPFIGIAAAVLFGFGLGSHLRLACYPMADLGQGVAFFTGDTAKAQSAVTLFMIFLVIFLLVAIATIVANFLSIKKKKV